MTDSGWSKRLARAGLAGVLCLGLGLAGCGESSSPSGMGPLTGFLPASGTDGAWSAQQTDDGFTLTNETDPEAITYFYVDANAQGAGEREIAVDVRLDRIDGASHAGLIYGFQPADKSYFLFLLEPDDTVGFYRRDASGLNRMMSSGGFGLKSGWNRLAIQEKGSEIDLMVNGKKMGSLGSDGMGQGATGIAAWGTGAYAFRGFAVKPEPQLGSANDRADAPPAVQPARTAANRPAPSRTLKPGDPGLMRLKRFDIVDKTGFAKPVTVASFLAPADWQMEGGVTWHQDWKCLRQLASIHVRVRSPDGRTGFEAFPFYTQDWYSTEFSRNAQAQQIAQGQQACPLGPPFDAKTFISQMLVPGFRQGAEIVDAKARPEVAQAAADELRKGFAAYGQQPPPFEVDAVQATLSYGQTEEWIFATTGYISQQAPDPGAMLHGNYNGTQTYQMSFTDKVYGFYAPKGELQDKEALIAAMIGSIRINQGWQRAYQQAQNNISRIIQKGIADRAAITRKANEEIMQMRQESFDYASAVQDKAHERFSQYIRDVEPFVDPSTNTQVEMPAGYDSVWTNGLDEYILVEPAATDPNEYFDGDWRQMRRQQ